MYEDGRRPKRPRGKERSVMLGWAVPGRMYGGGSGLASNAFASIRGEHGGGGRVWKTNASFVAAE
jgi:hypothetical protein